MNMGKSRKLLMVTLTFVCTLGVMLAPSKVVKAGGATVTLEVSSGEDITAELKKAVNDTSNERVIIPSGSYTLGRCEITRSNVTIVARGATLKVRSDSAPRMIFTNTGSLTGIAVEGGTWNNTGSTGAAIRFCHSGTARHSGCTINGGNGNAVELYNSKELTLKKITIKGASRGLDIDNVKKMTADTVKASKCSNEGIRLDGVKAFVLKNSNFSDNKKYGIRILNNSYNATDTGVISSTTASSNGINGVHFEKVSGLQFDNVKINNNKNYGIAYYGYSTSNGANLICNSCEIKSNTSTGIRIDSKGYTTKVTLNNCTVSNNGSNGVDVTGKKCKAVVSGGSYKSNGPAKVKKSSHSTEGAGIDIINGATATVKKAVIQNNKSCGISIFASNSCPSDIENVTITDCKIINNLRHGIAAECAFKTSNGKRIATTNRKIKKMKIENNTISQNKNHGIMLMVNCTVSSLKGNSIKNNNQSGLYLTKSVVTKSQNNTISANKLYGANVTYSSKIAMNGDKITSNKNAGVYSYSSNMSLTSCTISKNGKFGIKASAGTLKANKCIVVKNKSAGIRTENKVNASITKNTISSNVEGISIQKNTKAKNVDGNIVKGNGNRGIYCDSSTISSMRQNTITGHKTRGICISKNSKAHKVENNILSNPVSSKELVVDGGAKSNVPDTVMSVQFTAKKGTKKITGTATANMTVKVEVKNGSKVTKYSGKVKFNQTFSVKVKSLKSGSKIRVYTIDKAGNTYYNKITL